MDLRKSCGCPGGCPWDFAMPIFLGVVPTNRRTPREVRSNIGSVRLGTGDSLGGKPRTGRALYAPFWDSDTHFCPINTLSDALRHTDTYFEGADCIFGPNLPQHRGLPLESQARPGNRRRTNRTPHIVEECLGMFSSESSKPDDATAQCSMLIGHTHCRPNSLETPMFPPS